MDIILVWEGGGGGSNFTIFIFAHFLKSNDFFMKGNNQKLEKLSPFEKTDTKMRILPLSLGIQQWHLHWMKLASWHSLLSTFTKYKHLSRC